MKTVERLFERYGRTARLNGDPVQVFTKSTRRSTQETYTPLGSIPQGQYICCVPASAQPQVGDSLAWDGETHEICQVEEMKAGKHRLYWRVTVQQKGGEDTWGM